MLRKGQIPQLLHNISLYRPITPTGDAIKLLGESYLTNATFTSSEEQIGQSIVNRLIRIGSIVEMGTTLHFHGAVIPTVTRSAKYA